MFDDFNKLPDDPALLKGLIASMASELTSRDVLIAKLKYQLSGLRRQQFGARSESLDQLELTLEEEEIARAAEAPAPLPESAPDCIDGKKQPKRRPLPDHLPRRETVLGIGEDCASCGGKLRRLGQDATEELEYVPGGFVVNRIVRPRTACSCCEKISQAALPSRPIERGRLGAGAVGPCSGQQIRRPSSALSAKPDIRTRRDRSGALNARRLGG